MKDEIREKSFKPKAHILSLLGNELIKSPVMAIYELIKNSYDADASHVNVIFKNLEEGESSFIVVEDDGIGMTDQIIEEVWLEPGTDFRKPLDTNTGNRITTKTFLLDRVPMGEKGVGRFAVHKLGNEILLITRPKIFIDGKKFELANYEIQLTLNWKKFEQSKHLSDIPIIWKIKHDPSDFRFKESSGTYIRISSLKEVWTKKYGPFLKDTNTFNVISKV